jgi:RNA polymerase sigma-70 factor (ECF subfamily)
MSLKIDAKEPPNPPSTGPTPSVQGQSNQPGSAAGGPPDDSQLLQQAVGGNGKAFHELVHRHQQRMYRLAVSLVGNSTDAEDVLQEALAGAYRNLKTFEGRSTVKTWLTRILITQAAKWRRDRRRGPMVAFDSLPEPVGKAVNPADHVGRQIDLQAALRQLSAEHREVLVLREFDGLAYEEIAQVLGVPRGTVESRLHRARNELREKLKGYQP